MAYRKENTLTEQLFGRHIKIKDLTAEQRKRYNYTKHRKYVEEGAGQQAKRRYHTSDKGVKTQAAYKRSPKGKEVNQQALRKRRALSAKLAFHPTTNLAHTDSPCIACGAPGEHLDHITPVCKGGEHRLRNLWPLCQTCNLKKGTKLWEAFITSPQIETTRVRDPF